MAEVETMLLHTNGIDTIPEEESRPRPADIEADMREMERRKRVEAIMNSRLFREELERIVDGQMREGPSTILQQLSDIMGMPAARIGSVFKSSNCVVPINDIRGVESMSYEKGEKILRCKLAAAFRLIDLYGWTQGTGFHITARLNADQELFLVNPFGMLCHEITASSLNKVNMQGQIVEHGTTNFGINTSQFTLHSVIHAARPDIRCAIYVACSSVIAVSAMKQGLMPLTRPAALLGEIAFHSYAGAINEPEEKEKLLRSLGPVSKVLLLSNHGAICCGETIEEAFYTVNNMIQACETQLKLLPNGIDNLLPMAEETRKAIYDSSRKPQVSDGTDAAQGTQGPTDNKERAQTPKWRVGGAEFEGLMRMLDNAGFRTGYIYRNPLIKSDIPKPKNDVEVPPAVSSLGYLIEEEEFLKQGIWRKGDPRKGGDRSRWLNSPNVYQKVEVLETGTQDPKKITKWVAEASPTHSSTPVKIEHALQFVPTNTNPKEFKRIQQQIKDNRRADKISAGPQSHILEGVSWDEANRLKDATVSAAGDHVVLMGAASKGIIQRGYQHNATVYKAPYAKNPFDSVTDDELNEYKKTVEKKRHGDYTDTDFSESEALSSLQISSHVKDSLVSPPSHSEPEDAEHHVLRIETKQVPKASQPEVVLSDDARPYRTYNFAGFCVPKETAPLEQFHLAQGTAKLFLLQEQHCFREFSTKHGNNRRQRSNDDHRDHRQRHSTCKPLFNPWFEGEIIRIQHRTADVRTSVNSMGSMYREAINRFYEKIDHLQHCTPTVAVKGKPSTDGGGDDIKPLQPLFTLNKIVEPWPAATSSDSGVECVADVATGAHSAAPVLSMSDDDAIMLKVCLSEINRVFTDIDHSLTDVTSIFKLLLALNDCVIVDDGSER